MTPADLQKARVAGGLFIAAGVAFFAAAALSGQMMFYAVGVALNGVGIVFIARARKDAAK